MPWVVPFGPRVPNMFGFYDDDDESNELAYITVLIVSFYKKRPSRRVELIALTNLISFNHTFGTTSTIVILFLIICTSFRYF